MKRKLFCGLLCALLLFVLPLSVMADSLPLVVDDAQILTTEEEHLLASKAAQLQQEYQMDVVILTLPSLDGTSAQTYAEDFFDYNGYGSDDERSGTVFLLAMEEREWYIDTSGNAIYALTDYALLEQEERILPYLRSGEYYDAFDAWLDSLDEYFSAYENGAPVDDYVPEEDRYHGHSETVYYEDEPSVNWMVSVIVGLAAGAITVGVMYATMNTRRRQHSAEEYLKDGSYHMRVHRDVFLYSQVSKTRRETNSGSGGSRGGGSSVHRSSSGRSHGGRGGKF